MTHPEGVSLGRRLAAIAIDWLTSYLIAFAFCAGGGTYAERISGTRVSTPLIFLSEYAILIALTGASFGHRLLKLKVVQFQNGAFPAPLQVLVRTVLMAIVVTAITYDEDGRGIHERLSGTRLTTAN